MSASKQKRERREARAQGTDKQTLRAQAEQQTAAAKRSRGLRIGAGIAAAAVVLGAVVGVVASGSTYRSVEAVQVGGVSVSAAEYNYYYSNVCSTYVAQYNEYMGMLGVSVTAADLEKQTYNEETGETWGDRMHAEAQDTIRRVYTMAGAANAEGVSLSADAQAALDSSIEALDEAASIENVTHDEYLENMYGRGMDYDTWLACAETAALADTYMAQKKSTFEYSDAEAVAYYDANEATYKTYDYRSFLFSVSADAADKTAAFAGITKQAEEFAHRYKAGETFRDLVLAYVNEDARSYYEESDLTLYKDTVAGNISSAYRDWVTDPARKTDEIGIVYDEEGGCIYVLNFLGKSDATDAEKAEIALADLQTTAFEEWLAAEKEKYPLTEKGLGLYLADKAL